MAKILLTHQTGTGGVTLEFTGSVGHKNRATSSSIRDHGNIASMGHQYLRKVTNIFFGSQAGNYQQLEDTGGGDFPSSISGIQNGHARSKVLRCTDVSKDKAEQSYNCKYFSY